MLCGEGVGGKHFAVMSRNGNGDEREIETEVEKGGGKEDGTGG